MKLSTTTTLLAILSTVSAALASKVFEVSGTSTTATHRTIQAAINDCAPGDSCTIHLVDSVYVLDRAIWMVGKTNLALVGATVSGQRPKLAYRPELTTMVASPFATGGGAKKVRKVFTLPFLIEADGKPCAGDAARCGIDPKRPSGWLMWPYRSVSTPGAPTNLPGDAGDTSNPYSATGFQRNGMIELESSRDVRIEGLLLDGGRSMCFLNTAVWSGMYDLLFGSVGLNSTRSLRTTLRDCEIRSFFAAVYLHGDTAKASPLGQTGDQLLEKNWVHDNWWFVYDEMERDLGSTIRYNVAWNNIDKALQHPDSLADVSAAAAETNNQTGGFLFQFDSVVAAHKIHNNTFHRHGIVVGYGGWGKRELLHQFYNNILAGPVDSMGSGSNIVRFGTNWRQILQYAGPTVYNNTFELEGGVKTSPMKIQQALVYSDTLPNPYLPGTFCTSGCYLRIEPATIIGQIQPQFLWNGWQLQPGVTFPVFYTDSAGKRWGPFLTTDRNGYDSTGLISVLYGRPGDTAQWRAHQNLFAFRLPLQSRDPQSADFLRPDWSTLAVAKTVRKNGWNLGPVGLDGLPSDRGAFCYDSIAGQTKLGDCSDRTTSIAPRVPSRAAAKTGGQGLSTGSHDALGRTHGRKSWLFR